MLPGYRRRGIGGALLAACERFARERRVPALRVNVLARNRIARKAYAAAGYREYELLLVKPLR